MSPKLGEVMAKQGDAIDSRYHPSEAVRRGILNKVFPTHWSFLLGEIALYSFIILLIMVTPILANHGLWLALHAFLVMRGISLWLRLPKQKALAFG